MNIFEFWDLKNEFGLEGAIERFSNMDDLLLVGCKLNNVGLVRRLLRDARVTPNGQAIHVCVSKLRDVSGPSPRSVVNLEILGMLLERVVPEKRTIVDAANYAQFEALEMMLKDQQVDKGGLGELDYIVPIGGNAGALKRLLVEYTDSQKAKKWLGLK